MKKCVFLLLLMFSALAGAESVRVLAISGGRALVDVNNSEFTMSRGAQIDGVRLIGISGGAAEFSILGDLHRLSVGQTAVVTASSFTVPHNFEGVGVVIHKSSERGTVKEYSIPADRRGRYYVMGTINGALVRFQVDTGADTIVMSRDSGLRIGLPFEKGVKVMSTTASGRAGMHAGFCREVVVGNIRLLNVVCTVSEKNDNGILKDVVLLGNSFLRYLKIRQEGGYLTLVHEL